MPVTIVEPYDSTNYSPATVDNAPGSYDYSDTKTLVITPATVANGPAEDPITPVQLNTTGGNAPYTYSVTAGSLPPFLTLDSAGLLSGTPGGAGVFSWTVTSTDAYGFTATQGYSPTYTAPTITIIPPTVVTGTAGYPYAQPLGAVGGVAPYTYTVTAGSLPSGITLTAAGLLTGTPTGTGASSFTVTATDFYGFTATINYTISVSTPPIVITPTTLPLIVAENPYSETLSASGGTAPYTYAVTVGSLPPGITLSPTGTLSGTTNTPGTFNFTITATDNLGYPASINYSTTIQSPPIVIVPATLAPVIVDQPYSVAFGASGGTFPYVYSTTGTLPPGMTLNSLGLLSGTPTVPGDYEFSVVITDFYGFSVSTPFVFEIQPLPYIVLLPSFADPATVGEYYGDRVFAEGGTTPYVYTISEGTLPAIMTLDPDTGVVSGVPTAIGNYPFTITATDYNGFTGSRMYYLVVEPVPPPDPTPDTVVRVFVGGELVEPTLYTVTNRNPVVVAFDTPPPAGAEVTIGVYRGYSWYAQGAASASDGIPLQLQHTPAAEFLNGK